jgi:RNA polymerase sigma factor (TIGR02999 family)
MIAFPTAPMAMDDGRGQVTELLQKWADGDAAAFDRLLPLVYSELRRLADRSMHRERPGHTLQPTALVNEAYLRLIAQRDVRWQSRVHFFAIAARCMRRILVDYARTRHYQKRGGNLRRVTLDADLVAAEDRWTALTDLDEALTTLAQIDERKARIVELRFFAGLSIEETAAALNVSAGTIMRDWTFTKAWLRRTIGDVADTGSA